MVYSGICLLPKSNSSSTLKSEQNNLNNPTNNQPNVTNNNLENHLKHAKKLSSTGSTSNRSSESFHFNETSSSNVTIKSDLNKFKNPKLAPEIIFLIKEHAKTLDKINQISKRLQEIELKVDDISQRLSRENSLNNSNNNYHKPVVNDHHIRNNDRTSSSSSTNDKNQKDFSQSTRLPTYNSTYKDVDHHLSNNLSNNATNIPNNQILSDDSGGEYGNKTNKTVSDDDELLSILDKITKCSQNILQTQQAYQQQSATIYNSLSKPYAYNNGLMSHQFNNQFNNQLNNNQLNNLQTSRQQYQADIYNQQQNLYVIPYVLNPLNAKSPIKTTSNQKLPNNIQHPQNLIHHQLKFNAPIQPQQTASLNELLFEPNVERFLSNLDQLVHNDDTNLAAILRTNQQQQSTAHLMNQNLQPILQQQTQQQQQFIQLSPHQTTSTPISSQPIPINNLRTNCLSSNLSPNLMNSQLNSSYNLGQHLLNLQPSINNQTYNLNNISMHNACSQNLHLQQQQFLNWQKARELIEKKERERIDSQIKQADEWFGMVDNCINRNKFQQNSANKTKQSQHNSNLQANNLKGDEK